MAQNITDLPRYRYRLHSENCLKKFKRTKPLVSLQLSGITLHTDKWVSSQNPVEKLKPYLKKRDNLDGIVEWEEYIPGQSGRVIETSEGKTKSDKKINKESNEILKNSIPLQMYTISDLSIMNRELLVEVAEELGLVTKRIRNDKLIKKILEKQSEIC